MLVSWWRQAAMRRMANAAVRTRTCRRVLKVEALEDRVTPAGIFAVGALAGTTPNVTIFDADTQKATNSFLAYDSTFAGGVRVAVGDVNGDGTPDVITGPGLGGGPVVNVFSSDDGRLLKSFTVGDGTTAGVGVAVADFNADGIADIVVGGMQGGQPLVQVLKFSDGSALHTFHPFTGTNGVVVGAGDTNGDGTPDVVVGAGPGAGSRVVVFDGKTESTLMSFFAFDPEFSGGITLGVGDLDGDGKADIACAAGVLGGPRIQVFKGADGSVFHNFFAYDVLSRQGALVTVFDANGDGSVDLVTCEGPDRPFKINAFDGTTLAVLTPPNVNGLPVAGNSSDTGVPTVTLSSSTATTTRTTPIPITATFSEAVSGFSASGIVTTNGTVGGFSQVDAKTYNFNVTPTADGIVTVQVANSSAVDAAGNKNSASAVFTRTFDSTGPNATANNLVTNDTTPQLTGTVSEVNSTVSVEVSGQTFAATVSGLSWTATVPNALAEGTYTINLTATDALGNSRVVNSAGTLTIDTTKPTATVTSTAPEPTPTSPIPFQVDFSEAVTGFALTDITITNGTGANFTPAADNKSFTFSVTPTTQGAVTITIPADKAGDAAGNGNIASTPFTRTYDTGPPTVTANPLTTNDTTPTLTGTVDDLTATVTVTVNGQVVNATVTGTNWSATIPVAIAEGTYDIQASATDSANQTGSTTLTNGLVIDTTAPTTTLVTNAPTNPTNLSPIPYTVTFSENVPGFTSNGLTVTGGQLVNFVHVDDKTYTFGVTPNADGPIDVSVVAGSASDAAGNGIPAFGPLTVTSDRTNPIVGIDAASSGPITGTASDSASGVSGVQISILDTTLNKFWDGSAFASDTEVLLTTTSADSFAHWTYGYSAAGGPDGTFTVHSIATDGAGNTGQASQSVVVNGIPAPNPPVVTGLDPASDQGVSNSDGITRVTRPAIIGTTETGTTVHVIISQGGTTITEGDATVTGTDWTFTPASALLDGTYSVTATASKGGKSSVPSSPVAFTIDTVGPTTTLTTPQNPTDAAPILFTVQFGDPVYGFAPNDIDNVTGGTIVDGSFSADPDGRTFTFLVTPTSSQVTVTLAYFAAADLAGNGSNPAGPLTVDYTGPLGS